MEDGTAPFAQIPQRSLKKKENSSSSGAHDIQTRPSSEKKFFKALMENLNSIQPKH